MIFAKVAHCQLRYLEQQMKERLEGKVLTLQKDMWLWTMEGV